STTFPAGYGWMAWGVLAIVQDAYINSNPAEFLVKFETEGKSSDYSRAKFHSNDYTDDTDLCPKLVIYYTAVGVEILRPDAVGDETSIPQQSPIGGEHWDKVDEVDADDASTTVHTYSTSGDYRDLYNLPAPLGAGTINKITVHIRCRENYGYGFCHVMASIKSDTTVTDGTDHLLPDDTAWHNYSHGCHGAWIVRRSSIEAFLENDPRPEHKYIAASTTRRRLIVSSGEPYRLATLWVVKCPSCGQEVKITAPPRLRGAAVRERFIRLYVNGNCEHGSYCLIPLSPQGIQSALDAHTE
ncbi:unnamed protein product, partial [marine sediment metagenome]